MRKNELLGEYVHRWRYRDLRPVLWLLEGAATSRALDPEIGTSEWGLKMWHIAGARAAHKAIRASGRRCCEEACRAAAEKRRNMRKVQKRDQGEGKHWRTVQIDLGEF